MTRQHWIIHPFGSEQLVPVPHLATASQPETPSAQRRGLGEVSLLRSGRYDVSIFCYRQRHLRRRPPPTTVVGRWAATRHRPVHRALPRREAASGARRGAYRGWGGRATADRADTVQGTTGRDSPALLPGISVKDFEAIRDIEPIRSLSKSGCPLLPIPL